ncbi:MAG: formimidoylglutamase [Coriobacteriia bacterium]|nr:formimidoylglutamase [Coriobacteriia bacterium]
MAETPLHTDPLWPRAASWLVPAEPGDTSVADIGILGIPAYRTSITPTGAHATPAAVREALRFYSTYSASRGVDVAELVALDFGDVAEPDGAVGQTRVQQAVGEAVKRSRLLLVVGGDNSLTQGAVLGVAAGGSLADVGLITIDAHHDLRDGVSNGSPVRQLLEAGLPGGNVVQIGIGDFSNSAAYAKRASDTGITVVPRSALRGADLVGVCEAALAVAGAGGRRVFVDVDVDVCDRAEVPGCPSAAPGGISADELRVLVGCLASDSRVVGFDLTEIDATIDAADGRTVRLAALLLLEAAAGFAVREKG